MKQLSLLIVLLLPMTAIADFVEPADSVSSYVNIRQAATAESDIVGRLAKGGSYPLVAAEGSWLEVELPDGGTGFVHADWARVVTDEPTPPEVAAAPAAEPPMPAAGEPAETAADAPTSTAATEPEPEGKPDPVPAAPVDQQAETAVAAQPEPDSLPETVPDSGAGEVASRQPDPVVAPTVVTPPAPEPAPASAAAPGKSPLKGTDNFLVRFKNENEGRDSQIFDDGNFVGIGTTAPKQRLEVNGSVQIHDQNSNLAGIMITQSAGDTGYILHNRANTMTIGAGSIDRITIDRDGNIGIGESDPDQPLQMASGAHVTAGGVWTNNSSRAAKQDISALSSSDALQALLALDAVQFRYRNEATETYLGFIAEDVPELVATADRRGLSSMDIVAVLTKVVQDQQRRIEALESRLARD